MFSTTTLTPRTASKSLTNTVTFGSVNVSFLLNGEDTGGTFALVETAMRPGNEPPYHVHDREDEMFYILEGHITIMVDGALRECYAGDSAFLPRGIPHTFRVRSSIARGLVMLSGAGFEKYFQAIGKPAASLEPPIEASFPPDFLDIAGRAAADCGIRFLAEQPQF